MRLFGTGLGSDALPTTQAELLRSAQELERALEAMPIAANARNIARRRAATQFKLGRIRVELGQSREAESLFAQAASGFWELGSPSDRDLAAWARIRQAATAAEARRTEEALAILDKMIEQFGGFPTLDNVPSGPADALSMWLRLLEQTNDPRRLYEAAGVALAMLDPQEHAAFCTALACRAGSADELGYSEEAVTVYEQAIAWAEEEQPDLPIDAFLDHAMRRVAALLDDLGRDEEAAAAYRRLIERFKAKRTWRSRQVAVDARDRLTAIRGRRETGQ
jgi:tetratricopeptide (TPR) repeat protein